MGAGMERLIANGRSFPKTLGLRRLSVAVKQGRAVTIGWHDDVNDAQAEIEKHISEVESGSGVLILTDMFGGTPSNIALSFHNPGTVDVLTGVNLPMIIKIANQKEGDTLQSLARTVRDQGRSSIAMASDFLGT